MKLVSWNVNGFRACLNKDFEKIFNDFDADIFSIQETKMQEGQADFHPDGYNIVFHSAEKKGYSGTAVFSKEKPLNITFGMDNYEDNEGRIINLEFENFILVNCYVPNSQRELTRLLYRMEFENLMKAHLKKLEQIKPIIYCGDLNVAHAEIDLKNPKTNKGNAGFTMEEREKMTLLLDSGFVDSFRFLYPDLSDIYSWWSYRFKAREKNAGWRIDYFILSDILKKNISDAKIHTDVLGSDHCPVSLEINF